MNRHSLGFFISNLFAGYFVSLYKCVLNGGTCFVLQVSIFFDILFMVQHYVLYRPKKTEDHSDPNVVSKEPLLETSDHPHSDSV